VRLLFDQNLSHRLVPRIVDVFAGSAHVRDLGMADATDRTIWDYARFNHWAIISKDGDFHQLSLLYGAPPQVVWLRAANASTAELAQLIRDRSADIQTFMAGEGALLVLGP